MKNNSDLRTQAIASSLRDYKASGNNRTENIEYRNANRSVEVIRVNPTILLLNHNNHRVQAQLQDHPQKALVEQEPGSAESQAIISRLLAETDDFKTLKAELKAFGQINPGLVTRDGLVMNGNTRVVALRELGVDGVLVGVLPEDATGTDLLSLEVSLQMRKPTQQDYTFTNELLLLEELGQLFTPAEIGKKMHWSKNVAKRLAQASRLLALINEIRALHSHKAFPYSYFDSKRELLINLDEAYQSAIEINFEDAEKLKWTRIWAMLHGASKDQVRAIDSDFIEYELSKRLDIQTTQNLIPEPATSDEADDLFGAPQSSPDVKNLSRTLVNQIVTSEGIVAKEVDATYDHVGRQIRLATDDLIKQARQSAILAEPSEILREARISISTIEAKFEEYVAHSGFDASKFSYELKQTSKSISNLQLKFQNLR